MASRRSRERACFLVIGGNHPSPPLAGDYDFEQTIGCLSATGAEQMPGIYAKYFLAWLGKIDQNIATHSQIFEVLPNDVGRAFGEIREEIQKLEDVAYLKIVFTAPLIFVRGEWWAIGAGDSGEVHLYGVTPILHGILDRGHGPRNPGNRQEWVVFHAFRFWGKVTADQLPIDLPEQDDLEKFRRIDEFRNVQFSIHLDNAWSPLGVTPFASLEPGPRDINENIHLLQGRSRLSGPFDGPIWLLSSAGQLKSWAKKFAYLARAIGIDDIIGNVVFGGSARAFPRGVPGVVLILSLEILDITIVAGLLALLPLNIPIAILDENHSVEYSPWAFDECLGEENVLEQVLMIWRLKGGSIKMKDRITKNDAIAGLIEESRGDDWITERLTGAGAWNDDVRKWNFVENVESVIRETCLRVLSRYNESSQIFFAVDSDLGIRRLPELCLTILGADIIDETTHAGETGSLLVKPLLVLIIHGGGGWEGIDPGILTSWISRYEMCWRGTAEQLEELRLPEELSRQLGNCDALACVSIHPNEGPLDLKAIRNLLLRTRDLSLNGIAVVSRRRPVEDGTSILRNSAEFFLSCWESLKSDFASSDFLLLDLVANGQSLGLVKQDLDYRLENFSKLVMTREVRRDAVSLFSEIFNSHSKLNRFLVDSWGGLKAADVPSFPTARECWTTLLRSEEISLANLALMIGAAIADRQNSNFHNQFRGLLGRLELCR